MPRKSSTGSKKPMNEMTRIALKLKALDKFLKLADQIRESLGIATTAAASVTTGTETGSTTRRGRKPGRPRSTARANGADGPATSAPAKRRGRPRKSNGVDVTAAAEVETAVAADPELDPTNFEQEEEAAEVIE